MCTHSSLQTSNSRRSLSSLSCSLNLLCSFCTGVQCMCKIEVHAHGRRDGRYECKLPAFIGPSASSSDVRLYEHRIFDESSDAHHPSSVSSVQHILLKPQDCPATTPRSIAWSEFLVQAAIFEACFR